MRKILLLGCFFFLLSGCGNNSGVADPVPPEPGIYYISPAFGAVTGGETLTIVGLNFSSTSVVSIGGLNCPITSINQFVITCTVPLAPEAGAYTVTVSNAFGQSSSYSSFSYNEQPTITSLNPKAGPLAGLPAGSSLNILGKYFLPSPTITVGGQPCTNPTYQSSTSVTCVPPPNLSGGQQVVLTNYDGQFSTPYTYTYQAGPVVTKVTPPAGPLAGTSIAITGTGFIVGTTVSSSSAVILLDSNDTSYSCPSTVASDRQCTISSVASVSTTSIACGLPDNLAGTYTIVVVNPDCQYSSITPATPTAPTIPPSSINTYTYQPAPSLDLTTPISPQAGPIQGGNLLTITGSDFISPSVTVGGLYCGGAGPLTVNTNPPPSTVQTLTCPLPACTFPACTVLPPTAVSKSSDVIVTNSDGQNVTSPINYTYQGRPRVTGVSPTAGPAAGSSGVTITISGSSFVETPTPLTPPTVTVGGTPCQSVSFTSSTSLTCTSPVLPVSTTAYPIFVTNPDGQVSTETASYTAQSPPTVSGISPTGGSVNGGTILTIDGYNFIFPLSITINGKNCSVRTTSPLTCFVGSNSGVTAHSSVVVTNPDGQQSTSSQHYYYNPAPGASSSITLNPSSIIENTTGSIVISGSGILCSGDSGATRDPAVTFLNPSTLFNTNCVSIPSVTFCTSGTITCSFSAGASSVPPYEVTVTNYDGQSNTPSVPFAVGSVIPVKPIISSIYPPGGPVGNSTQITITSATPTFQTPVRVMLGSTALTILSEGPSSIVCTVPPCATMCNSPYDLQVTNTFPGGDASDAYYYYYNPPPTITGVTVTPPRYVAGGTSITIAGTGFLCSGINNSLVNPTVTFVTTSPLTTHGTLSFVTADCSASSISGNTPPNAAGTYDIVVTNYDGQSSVINADSKYEYYDAPSIASVTPTVGGLDGFNAITTNHILTITSNSDGVFDCSGLGPILSLSSYSGTCTASTAYGTCVSPTITNTATSATFTVPDNTPHGEADCTIYIANPDGQTSTEESFIYHYQPPPTISSFSPQGGVNGGGNTLTVTGAHFYPGSLLLAYVGGNTCGILSVNLNYTILTCSTPSLSNMHSYVTVTTEAGTADSGSLSPPIEYYFNAKPSVLSITVDGPPTQQQGIAGATSVTITGTGFLCAGAGSVPSSAIDPVVTFQRPTNPHVNYGILSPLTCNSASSITGTTPPNAAGAYTVRVTNYDGQQSDPVGSYIYYDRPVIESVVTAAGIPTVIGGIPDSIPGAGGQSANAQITITGTGFELGATVKIGSYTCSVFSHSIPTSITCTPPIGPSLSSGSLPIVVTNFDGQTSNNNVEYTYNILYRNPDVFEMLSSTVLVIYGLEADLSLATGVTLALHTSPSTTHSCIPSATSEMSATCLFSPAVPTGTYDVTVSGVSLASAQVVAP